jgi:hypothetical protein
MVLIQPASFVVQAITLLGLVMDYNNDPTTHPRDVQTLFEEAESEIRNLQ